MVSKIIILENTIIDRETGMILEREPGADRVTLHVPGLPAPHVFEGSDAHELWKAYDDRAPDWH